MKPKKEFGLKRHLSVRDFINQNFNVIKTLPGITVTFKEYDDLLGGMEKKIIRHEELKTGIIHYREKWRERLNNSASDISRRLSAFAVASDPLSLEKLDHSESAISRLKDLKMGRFVTSMYDYANLHLTDLKDYGITSVYLKDLNDLKTGYDKAVTEVEIFRSEKKLLTESITMDFIHAKELLKKLEYLFRLVKTSNAVFYNEFVNLCKAKENSRSTVNLVGKIIDAKSGAGLHYAELKMEKTGEVDGKEGVNGYPPKEFFKKVRNKGGFYMRSVPSGLYRITVHKVGYESRVIELAIDGDLVNRIEIAMEKSDSVRLAGSF